MKKIIILLFPIALILAPLPSQAQGNLSLSQTNLSLAVGQNTTITAYPPSNQIVNIMSMSNTYVALANITNNIMTVYGVGSGSTQITLCTYDNTCGTVYITVSGSSNYNGSSGQISFSQNNLNLNVNQTATVSVSNSTGSVYISNNSNSNTVSAYVSGNTISLNGLNSGSSTITVCSNSNQCNYLYVTVGSSNNTSGQIGLSQSSVSMNVNDTTLVTVYNNTNNQPYISNNSNANVVTANLSGNLISLRALTGGYASITVCAYSMSQCTYLNVTVSGGNTYGAISFSQTLINLNLNQNTNITIYGSSANYYISNNSNPSAVTASVSGQNIYLYGQNSGSSTLTICSNYGGSCGTLYAYVNQYSSVPTPLSFASTSLPMPIINQYYSAQIMINGGTAPYSFNLASGFLPAGLSMSNPGLITGVPYSNGSATFTLIASDAYGRSSPNQTFTLTPSYTAVGNVLGAYSYNNGVLINDSGTVYLIYKNTKSGFTSSYAFTGLGYSFANVSSGTTSGINSSGYTISNPNMAHPWGSWIKSGTTIYFVDPSGLIPIPSFDVFIGNGGIAQQVVSMNSYDAARPIMPIMTNNDPRLR